MPDLLGMVRVRGKDGKYHTIIWATCSNSILLQCLGLHARQGVCMPISGDIWPDLYQQFLSIQTWFVQVC